MLSDSRLHLIGRCVMFVAEFCFSRSLQCFSFRVSNFTVVQLTIRSQLTVAVDFRRRFR